MNQEQKNNNLTKMNVHKKANIWYTIYECRQSCSAQTQIRSQMCLVSLSSNNLKARRDSKYMQLQMSDTENADRPVVYSLFF